MAQEPKILDIYIGFPPQTAGTTYPRVQDIYIQTSTVPALKAFHLTITQPTNLTNYPKLQAIRIDSLIGPTFWLNGQVMPGIKPPTGKV